MTVKPEYCDDCGDPIPTGQGHPYPALPLPVSSANEGESGVLCASCSLTMERMALKAQAGYDEAETEMKNPVMSPKYARDEEA